MPCTVSVPGMSDTSYVLLSYPTFIYLCGEAVSHGCGHTSKFRLIQILTALCSSLPWNEFAISNSGERGKRWHVPQSVALLRRHGLPMFHIPHPSPSLLCAQASRLGALTGGRSVTLDSASVGSIQPPCL